MLIAEDLLLLLTDDNTGRLCAPALQVDFALAGANLIELALLDRITLSAEGADGHAGQVIVHNRTPTGDPVLDSAVERLGGDGTRPDSALRVLAKGLRTQLYERLTACGVLRSARGKILGRFARHTWPTEDAHHEAEVRGLITGAVTLSSSPDPHTAALIALLHALGCQHKVLDGDGLGLSQAQLQARTAAIASGNWASDAVRKTIKDTFAIVIAATTAATAAVVLPGAT
jgi:hypothetical protein